MNSSDNRKIKEVLDSLENKNIPNINELDKELDVENIEEIIKIYNSLEDTKIDLIRLKEILLGGE